MRVARSSPRTPRGARELLTDGVDALLVPPGDARGTGGSAVRRLAADRRARGSGSARAGRATYEEHASEAVLGGRWRSILERALADEPARPALARGPRRSRSRAGSRALAVLQHRAFWTGRFDVGNLVQAVWSTAHGDPLG